MWVTSTAWTCSRRATEAAEVLQTAGIVALSGLFSDPQLLARRHWRVRRHPEIGDQALLLSRFRPRRLGPRAIVSYTQVFPTILIVLDLGASLV